MRYVKSSFSLPAVSQTPRGEHLLDGSTPVKRPYLGADSARKRRKKRQQYRRDRAVAPSYDQADGGAARDRLF